MQRIFLEVRKVTLALAVKVKRAAETTFRHSLSEKVRQVVIRLVGKKGARARGLHLCGKDGDKANLWKQAEAKTLDRRSASLLTSICIYEFSNFRKKDRNTSTKNIRKGSNINKRNGR